MQMDVDFSHDPEHIPALIEAAADADLVLGSRYVAGGGVTDWGLAAGAQPRRLLVRAHRPRRAGQGPHRRLQVLPARAARAAGVRGFQTAGFGFQVEVTYRALRSGARVREVPIQLPRPPGRERRR